MLIRKSLFIGPLPPLYFGSGTIRVVESTTCLGVKLDCRLSWSEHVFQVKKSFVQKVIKAIKLMKSLPVKILQEIYFKTIIPSLTYCILIWGNCSTARFSSLDSIHSRAARIIFNLDSSISDAECLLNSHWPSISYFYKKSVLVFMHKVYFDSLSFWPNELFSKRVSSKSLRAINQMFMPSQVWCRKKFVKVQRTALMELCEQNVWCFEQFKWFQSLYRKIKSWLGGFFF